ncbi:BppU family phage baseplate upper protein [Enterococcus avium]|uniref:BppU family phage baseplate upper protein n=1 Tax=Enterococcus avium TaxID=33945 RepID=UPI00288CD629|nr:BppU family phage baseplate upper protein [Enterococcus avium]MDT2395447.1 BppU family phage baseplate upper protein [Enterococcus avium]MDT2441709.1 BppU family phage baseplate upper protein [Enterococcus avium]MDT2454655.1 BppU family phage baseplate upper protein [Enterococcus avium]
MFKTNNETILIDAKATDPIPTGVVFWSHDRGTAKLIFQLQKDYMNQPLSAGTIVPILLEFNSDTAEGGRGRHIYHAVIEDAVNGIVSIILEDKTLSIQGKVDGSIYIELPDSRSLDTAGRFIFHIKRSPIDEDVPELEDYYWQGFNEIIDEYHQTINTIKSEAKALIDSLTADVTTAQSKITQLEQSITTANTNLNARIDEINKKIDDNDVFTKAESSANVIYQILGKDITEITFTLNFKNKKTNSLVENPNKARVSANNNLITPTTVLNDYSQERYNSVSEIDKNYMAIWLETANQRAQSLFEFAILEEVIRHLGVDFFELQGLTTLKDQTTFLRSKMTNIQSDIWGKGVSQKGNKFYYTTFDNRGNNWGSLVTNESNTVEKTSLIISQSDLEIYLSDSGNMYFLAYSEQTDGTLATQLYIDYVELSFKLRVSTRDVIESMIAANHVENLATQEEAETGEDNKKIMTPLRVMQSIKKFVENKFVSIAGNETIGGLKNFRDGLMVNGNNVLTHKGVVTIKYSNADFPTEIASGYITFVRYSDVIQAVFNFKTRADTDFAKDQSIIWGIAADFQADTSEPQYIGIASTGGTTSIVKFTAGGSTLTAHSILLKDTWYAGTVTYLAKNKL